MIPLGGPLVLIGLALRWAYSFVPIVAYFIGAWSCVANRRLSRKLIPAAWGFGGLFAASATGKFASTLINPFESYLPMFWWILDLARTASIVVMVYGIRAALVEIGARTSPPKGPTDELA